MQPLPMYRRCRKRIFQDGILKCVGKANLAQNFFFPRIARMLNGPRETET